MHHEFLAVDGMKMSKSLQNFYTVDDVKKRGFEPLALRYLFLSAHYRQKLNFTWEALEGAQNSLNNIRKLYLDKKENVGEDKTTGEKSAVSGINENAVEVKSIESFSAALNEDLNAPKALAVFWDALKDSKVSNSVIEKMDKVLGLNLSNYQKQEKTVPNEVFEMAKQRDQLRKEKKFAEADQMRAKIVELGFEVEDTKDGTKVK
jgi:cysteinyl-tRNA synthetase